MIQGMTSASAFSAAYDNSETKDKAVVGKDDFLTLLVAQMKNQDPLNPMQTTEFTSQLAQFTSLEQLVEVNSNLGGIQGSIEKQNNGNPIDYIGKTVKADSNTMEVKDGVLSSGSFVLENGADVGVVVYDKDGNEVRSLHQGKMQAGEYQVNWNLRDNDGKVVDDGIYSFDIFAIDEYGEYIPVEIFTEGKVSGVTNEYDSPYLMVGNKLIPTSKVLKVYDSEE